MTEADTISTGGPWPKQFPELKELDDLLKCGICYEYMETTLISACSHSFCSLCIRKYLQYQNQCPTCFSKVYDNQLRNNRTLDSIVQVYLRFKDKLSHHLRISAVLVPTASVNSKDTPSLSQNNTPKREEATKVVVRAINHEEEAKTVVKKPQTNSFFDKKSISKKLVNSFQSDDLDAIEIIEPDIIKSPLPNQSSKPDNCRPVNNVSASPLASLKSPSVSKIRVPDMFTVSPKPHGSSSAVVVQKTVPCPVCSVDIPEANINLHLDKCLLRASGDQSTAPVEVKNNMKRLPKLVYTLLADKDLKKKAKEYGLNVLGDRKALISRLKRYTVIYNSECDKSSPKSLTEIKQQVDREEKLEQTANSSAEKPTALFNSITRNTDQKVINEANEKYINENKKNFDALIQKMKERNGQNIKPAGLNVSSRVYSDEEDGNSETEVSAPPESTSTNKSRFLMSLDDYTLDDSIDEDIVPESPVLSKSNCADYSDCFYPKTPKISSTNTLYTSDNEADSSFSELNKSSESLSMLADCQLDFPSDNESKTVVAVKEPSDSMLEVTIDDNTQSSEEIFITRKRQNKRKEMEPTPSSSTFSVSPRKLRKRTKR